jgi:diguanylate cyclase (GGDEF)-like protein
LSTLHEGQQLKVTVSVGLANWERGETTTSWLSRSDAALYRAKAAGRNRVDG